MEQELTQIVVANIPNFFFASLAIIILMRIIGKQDELINRLIDKWERCEENNDTQLLVTKKAGE